MKPDNILLSADREVVKLCDFGVSEMFEAQGDDRIKQSGGSPAFLSPESFTCQQPRQQRSWNMLIRSHSSRA